MVKKIDESLEDLLEQEILETLKRKYSVDSDKKAVFLLRLKYWVFNGFKDDDVMNFFFGRFLAKELGIVGGEFLFKERICSINRGGHTSLLNVVDNLLYQIGDTDTSRQINEEKLAIESFAKKEWRKNKLTKKALGESYIGVRNLLCEYYGLVYLRKKCGMDNQLINFDVHEQTSEYDYMTRLEWAALSYIPDCKWSEADIELHLYHHLNLYFEGLKPIRRQVVLGQGRIDIWAREIYGGCRDVLIEVKNEIDDRLLMQMKKYKDAYIYENGCSPRLIVVSTIYKEDMIRYLKEENVEIYLLNLGSSLKKDSTNSEFKRFPLIRII